MQAALRAWRSETARERNVPAYIVLLDATLDGIAAARPSTLNELRNIPGIGDKKLEHYGDQLLTLVGSSTPNWFVDAATAAAEAPEATPQESPQPSESPAEPPAESPAEPSPTTTP